MARRWRLGVISLLLAVVASTGGWIYYQQHHFKHFAVHEPGKVYASAWLGPDACRKYIETFSGSRRRKYLQPG